VFVRKRMPPRTNVFAKFRPAFVFGGHHTNKYKFQNATSFVLADLPNCCNEVRREGFVCLLTIGYILRFIYS
jgi:hypothetical protein